MKQIARYLNAFGEVLPATEDEFIELARHLRRTVVQQSRSITELEAKVAELENNIHEAQEVYAGMEGFIPRNAEAAYTLRVIEQMYKALLLEADDE